MAVASFSLRSGLERHEETSSEISSSLANSAAGSSMGGADSLISSKPRSSSLSSTRSWVKSTLGSFPCTAQIFSQISSQPARSWKLSARSKLSPLVQTIRVYCCFLYAVSDRIFNSSSVLEMNGVIA